MRHMFASCAILPLPCLSLLYGAAQQLAVQLAAGVSTTFINIAGEMLSKRTPVPASDWLLLPWT